MTFDWFIAYIIFWVFMSLFEVLHVRMVEGKSVYVPPHITFLFTVFRNGFKKVAHG